MKVLIFTLVFAITFNAIDMAVFGTNEGETNLHFDFKTENGQQRVEDIKYDTNPTPDPDASSTDEVTMNPVEYRGGYSFISADGYEYTVKYKANKNGFQPYVTAHKLVPKTST